MTKAVTFEDFMKAPLNTDAFFDEHASVFFHDKDYPPTNPYVFDEKFTEHLNSLLETNYSRVFVCRESMENGHYGIVSNENIYAMGRGFYIVTNSGKVIFFHFNEDIDIQHVQSIS